MSCLRTCREVSKEVDLARRLHWQGGCIDKEVGLARRLCWKRGCVGKKVVLAKRLIWQGGCVGKDASISNSKYEFFWYSEIFPLDNFSEYFICIF